MTSPFWPLKKTEVRTIEPARLSISQLQGLLQGAVAPRPIAFVATCDRHGSVNLSPFSFYNLFSTQPPVLIFSPALRARDGSSKHTLENLREVPECTVNGVNHAMVQQTSLASSEYPRGVNEFVKSGCTPLSSLQVAPPRVAESPIQMECRVIEIKALGHGPGAGNLVICEIVLIHLNEGILNEQGTIDPGKSDWVARLGGDWYARSSHGLFTVPKPLTTLGIGVDALPLAVRTSTILTGNDLGLLGNLEALPTPEDCIAARVLMELNEIAGDDEKGSPNGEAQHRDQDRADQNQLPEMEHIHREAQKWIAMGNIKEALALLMASQVA
ncbi:MAG: flavin reductase family protein [Sphingomonadales bacterium]|nr:flavin reductase family protein [Sphingomonadales bacterium]